MAIIYGTAGKDNPLRGTPDADSIYGLAGDDLIISNDGDDFIDAGDGDDQVNGYPGQNGSYTYYAAKGTLTIYGGNGNDFLIGGEGNNKIFGESGNDYLYGSGGNDLLDGGSEDDKLYGFEGNDTLDGSDGNDTLDGGSGDDVLRGGEGNDKLYAQNAGNDSLMGGNGNDIINAYTGSGDKLLDGAAGDDELYGGTGSDELIGGTGDDKLYGYEGNDRLDGSEGNDTLDGGTGSDFIKGGDGNDRLTTDEGNDTVYGGNGNDQINGYLTGSSAHAYTFWNASGKLILYGEAGNDVAIGGNSDDLISGGDGDDELYGRGGDDKIFGDTGNDYISADDGNDTLDGGTGINQLFGGDGNDIYYIRNKTDYIYDSAGTDTAYVSASFVKIPSTIEKVIFTDGALPLPYWIDALLPDSAAGLNFATLLGNSNVFKYSFPKTLPAYDTNKDDAYGFSPFSTLQINNTKTALAYISSVLNLKFQETTTTDLPNTFTFANNKQTNSGGYAEYPSSSSYGNDVFLNIAEYNTTLAEGTYGSLVLMHEVGHALGLKHPFSHQQAGEGGIAEGPYLTGNEDSTIWTVMSYESNPYQYLLNYSPLDIATLQYIYGPSTTSRTGNDTYKISQTTSNFIWDGAGTDTIDLSTVGQGSTVYLSPGYWGFVGSAKATNITAVGQITVNFGTTIENLFGTSYDDKLYGNEVANLINGGYGNDLIEGWDGNDILTGGQGDDLLTGGMGNDYVEGGEGTDTLVLSGLAKDYTIRFDTKTQNFLITDNRGIDGSDEFNSIEFLKFSDKILSLQSFDITPPSIAITSDISSVIASKTAKLSFILSKSSSNFELGDITVTGGTLSSFAGSGTVYTALFTPLANSNSNGVISVPSGVFTDASGNVNADGADTNNTITLTVDTVIPTIALGSTKGSLIAGDTPTLTFTLSEASTTFTASDVTVTGGTLTNFLGSGTTYTAQFTPSANSTANGVISVASGVFTDAAGNANADGADANNTLTLTVDTLLPTISVSSNKTNLQGGDTAALTFNLSEASTNFVASDITVVGGALSNFTGSGTSYTATFTLELNSAQNGAISVANGAFTDAAGNKNADGSDANNSVNFSRIPTLTNETHTLSVIVDKNVLGVEAVLLKDLKESMTFTNGAMTKHIVEYSGLTFDYNQIDSLIITVTRDGEFTQEFTREINDYLKTELNISYLAAVAIVGAASIDSIVLNVAGADGNYVG